VTKYVTLVPQGGQPVRLADQTGAPWPTTGTGSLVFSRGATLTNATLVDSNFVGDISYVAYVVNTLSDLKSLVAPYPSSVFTNGRLSAGDQAGGLWMFDAGDQSANVALDPASAVWAAPYTASSGVSGAWRRVVEENALDCKWFGAVGDAVQDPTTGAWTGTNNTVAFQRLEALATALSLRRFISVGAYIITDVITVSQTGPGYQSSSNVEWFGVSALNSLIIDKMPASAASTSLWAYSGVTDDDTSVVSYLTTSTTPRSNSFEVNDGSLLEVDQWIYLIDHAVPVLDSRNGSQVACVGEVARIASVSGDTITTYGDTTYGYTAEPLDPITGTTIRRFTAPISNISFHDFGVIADPTVAYVNTDRIINVRRAINFNMNGMRFIQPEKTVAYCTDVLGGNVTNIFVQRLGNSDAYTLVIKGSFQFTVDKVTQYGGRHMPDGSASSINGIESAFTTMSNSKAFNVYGAAFQSHAGTRDWIFSSCIASNVGITGTDNPGDAAFQLRGNRHHIDNCKAEGFVTGAYAVFGTQGKVTNCEFRSCKNAIRINRIDGFEAAGNTIYATTDSVDNAIYIDNPNDFSTRYLLRDNRVFGDVGVSCIYLGGQTIDPTWIIERTYAPDVTTSFGGVSGPSLALNSFSATFSYTLAVNANNITRDELYISSVLEIDGGVATRDVRAMVGGGRGVIRTITNVGTTNNITLPSESGSANPITDSFLLPGGTTITLVPSQSATFAYNTTKQRWLLVSS
jgi:hypothetical protein